VNVTNAGKTRTTTWKVNINLNGSILTSSYSGLFAVSSGTLSVTPLSWNSAIAPGASTEFGFCANSST
jgi:cellulase/cellobiase CelA1